LAISLDINCRKGGHPIDLNAVYTICNFLRDRYGNVKDLNLYFVVSEEIFDDLDEYAIIQVYSRN
jgi:hypothetical protein